jgi:2-octaprenyl-6-methoxy-1,4-benzoquinone methylase (EC 2.1.1.-)/demethylmenaquinone methyltransferase (EC 2.1.1.-)
VEQITISKARLKLGHKVLDVASGSGDLALAFSEKVGPTGIVVASDINEHMLLEGRAKLVNKGALANTHCVQLNAENIPFERNYFDRVTISFGLRNVTRKEVALKAMYDVIKPGGYLMVLEFSKPVLEPLQKMYDLYSFNVIPKLGKWVTGDSESYQYLVESIRKHPDQETLSAMMKQAGFDEVQCHNLTGGVVALHIGYKF